jgi:hypothetical protein
MKTILLGTYWQSDNVDKEPIEWIVLKDEEDKMYVLSKYCLDCIPYSNENNANWEDSFARKWLNTEFINNAFSVEEQDKILLSDTKTDKWWGPRLDEGMPVKDKIFIPSISEAILYFDSTDWHDIVAEQKRIARPTNYAYERGCWAYPLEYGKIKDTSLLRSCMQDNFNKNNSYWYYEGGISRSQRDDIFEKDTTEKRWSCRWYLRSPGEYIVGVSREGVIYDTTTDQDNLYGGIAIRPAIWVKK